MEYSEVPICHVCGKQVLLNSNELGFVACYECNIPICKSCFDHLAKQGGRASCVGCGASYEEELGVEEQVPSNHSTVARNVSSRSLMEAESSDDSHNAMWKNRVQSWQQRNRNAKDKESQIPHPQLVKKQQQSGDASEPLSRVIPLPNSQLVSYRAVIILRLIILGLFLYYRIKNPVDDAFGLGLTSVICEFWFAIIWVFDQFPKWFPINRETYLNVLSERYEREGDLAAVDIFITTRDPMIEPPWITANTVLSVLAMDYPAEKVCCYVSDDGAAMLTFESLVETVEFARK